jgi:hypothetical protein
MRASPPTWRPSTSRPSTRRTPSDDPRGGLGYPDGPSHGITLEGLKQGPQSAERRRSRHPLPRPDRVTCLPFPPSRCPPRSRRPRVRPHRAHRVLQGLRPLPRARRDGAHLQGAPRRRPRPGALYPLTLLSPTRSGASTPPTRTTPGSRRSTADAPRCSSIPTTPPTARSATATSSRWSTDGARPGPGRT